MAKIVVALLDSARRAEAVIDDLGSSGFDQDAIGLARNEGDQATPKVAGGPIAGGVVGSLTLFGVPQQDADFYADEVRHGCVLVTVICDDARARIASEIMDRHGALDAGPPASQRQAGSRTAPAPPGAGGEGRSVEGRETGPQPGGAYAGTERRAESRRAQSRREERARVAREQVDRPLSAAEREAAFRGTPIDIPETAEKLVVSKQISIREEIIAGREERESVRRTEVDVEEKAAGRDEGFLDPDDEDFRKHFQSYYSRRGEDYRGFQEAYRYGATMSQYTSKDWQDVEEDIHRDWDKDHPGTWNKFREAIHYGWETTNRP